MHVQTRRDIGEMGRHVTAICVDTLHHQLAMHACERMLQFGFKEVVWITDRRASRYLKEDPAFLRPEFRIEWIEPIRSIDEYSSFVLKRLPAYAETTHVLVFQWDGFAVAAEKWWDGYLEYDYVGAPWADMHALATERRVGNGGFSLRSRKLLLATADAGFSREPGVPEDVAIGVSQAEVLEQVYSIKFAPIEVAKHFSVEHTTYAEPVFAMPTFGFHGWFNFSLFFSDDEILEMLTGRTTPDERLALLRSWAMQRLMVNLYGKSRTHCFARIVGIFAEMTGRAEILNLTPQAQLESMSSDDSFN